MTFGDNKVVLRGIVIL